MTLFLWQTSQVDGNKKVVVEGTSGAFKENFGQKANGLIKEQPYEKENSDEQQEPLLPPQGASDCCAVCKRFKKFLIIKPRDDFEF